MGGYLRGPHVVARPFCASQNASQSVSKLILTVAKRKVKIVIAECNNALRKVSCVFYFRRYPFLFLAIFVKLCSVRCCWCYLSCQTVTSDMLPSVLESVCAIITDIVHFFATGGSLGELTQSVLTCSGF